MQHRSIDDPASHRLDKLGVWNTVKVTAEISINDLPMSGVDQPVDVLYCVQCAAVCPIGILFRLQTRVGRFCVRRRGRLLDRRYVSGASDKDTLRFFYDLFATEWSLRSSHGICATCPARRR